MLLSMEGGLHFHLERFWSLLANRDQILKWIDAILHKYIWKNKILISHIDLRIIIYGRIKEGHHIMVSNVMNEYKRTPLFSI